MKNKGFSLVELVVVLILLGLSISFVTPPLTRLSKTIELRTAAQKVSGVLRYSRSEAVNKGQVYQVLFDSELREIRLQSMEPVDGEKEKDEKSEGKISKKAYSLPEGVHLREVKIDSPQHPSDLPTIEFYPNGGSNGGSFLLDRHDRKGYKIEVDFLTGMVKVKKVEDIG